MRAFLLLCCVIGLSAATIEVQLTQNDVEPGSEVSLSLILGKAAEVDAWGYNLEFDPQVLQLQKMQAGTIQTFVPDSRAIDDINDSGEIRMGGYDLAKLKKNSGGQLVELTFRVQSSAPAGQTELRLSSFSASSRFGAVLAPNSSNVIPDLTGAILRIVGGVEGRHVYFEEIPDYFWKKLSPKEGGEVPGLPNEQGFAVPTDDSSEFALSPKVSG